MNSETIILDGRALSKKINSYIKSEIESLSLNEQQQQPTQNKDIPKGPDIQPSYTTKASTK